MGKKRLSRKWICKQGGKGRKLWGSQKTKLVTQKDKIEVTQKDKK